MTLAIGACYILGAIGAWKFMDWLEDRAKQRRAEREAGARDVTPR